MLDKPFEKESELQQMKSELSRLEREIAQKIQEKQQAQQQQDDKQLAINPEAGEGKNTAAGIEAKVINLQEPDNRSHERLVANSRETVFSPHQEISQVLKKTKGVRL